jgi:SGNH domain (fused to AT3 domains)
LRIDHGLPDQASYSLYLWHWPLIVFQRTDGLFAAELSGWTRLLVIAASVGIAALSRKFIELPFRAMARSTSKPLVFMAASGAIGSTAALCALVLVLSGAPARFPKRVVEIGAYLAYDASVTFRTGQCFLLNSHQPFDVETCMKMDATRPNYLLVGDSHAAHLWFGLATAMPEANVMQATASLWRPAVLSGSRYDTPTCRHLMQFVLDDFLPRNRVDKVLLAASWKDEDLPILATTLDILRSRNVEAVVLGPIVEYETALPRLLVDEIRHHKPDAAAAMRRPGVRERDREIGRIAVAHGAAYLSVYDAICHDGRCDELVEGDVPMQFDLGHLTAQGSVEVGRRLSALLLRKVAKVDDAANQ